MHIRTGQDCKKEWNIPAEQVLYREDGTWYHLLERFPAALCDAKGYILFKTEQAYKDCNYLQIGKEIAVPDGISRIPGYVPKS
jgi:5-methylcytosine-specific restriction protein A